MMAYSLGLPKTRAVALETFTHEMSVALPRPSCRYLHAPLHTEILVGQLLESFR